ncbi:TPA_asm: LysR family transcriptional regulator, partial [Listeria monocytogenes]|nr:LysR family transcriptional regulator [Listeria monocytogenes]
MDLKNLLTFKTILETGSFQEAARKLNYAQSTVTTQIQQLEQELQVKLFDKIGRKMLLTSAGSDLLPSVNQILETYNTMKNYSNNAELKGELRIAVPESILTYQMQSILKEFHEKAPNVK